MYDRPQKVIDAFDASLRRLGTDYIDVYWCHIWWDKPEETEAFLVAFDQLKTSCKVRAVGVSTDNIDHLRHFNRDDLIDAVQRLFHPEPQRRERDPAVCRGTGLGLCGSRSPAQRHAQRKVRR